MYPIVMLSTADWDNPFWTNKQHVACELARRGHRVLYVDSLGLRAPSATAQDMSRIFRRLKKAMRAPVEVRERVWVWSPIVVPLQKYAAVRWLNRGLVSAGLKFWQWRLKMKRPMFWTYNPMTCRFVDTTAYPFTVYHCVDEIKAQPGMPAAEIQRAEHELMRQCDVCFVTAEALLAERQALNPHTYCFTNVADYAHFAQARDEATLVPEDLMRLPSPRIGFIGAISGYKVDFALLQRLAQAHPEWSIVLIGKVGEGDPWTDASALRALPNLHFVGPKPYDTLPAYLKGFDVAIMPMMINDYTKSMFPMKFFEYLAAGKSVVSTDLVAIKQYAHTAHLASSHEDFIAGVETALTSESVPLEVRLDAAKDQTYERRTDRMMKIVNDMVAAKAGASA